MSGWFLDVFIVYVFRALRRAWTWRRTRGWPTRRAKIRTISKRSIGWGCPSVEVVYSYEFDETAFWTCENIPFFLDSSAKSYVYRHPENSFLIVRVNPNNPEMSVTTTDMVT